MHHSLATNPNSLALPSNSRQQPEAGSKNVITTIQKHRKNLDAWGRFWPTHIPDECLGDYTLKLTFPFWIKIFYSSDFNLLQRITKKFLSVGICFPPAFLDCVSKNQEQVFPADTINICTQSTGSYQLKALPKLHQINTASIIFFHGRKVCQSSFFHFCPEPIPVKVSTQTSSGKCSTSQGSVPPGCGTWFWTQTKM